MLAGYEHAEHATITGEGLQSLQEDPSFVAAQDEIIDTLTSKPYYREQEFTHKDISRQFTANGPSGKWYQAAWERNQPFYMVNTATVSATDINVSADGTIELTWVVTDIFDYIPDKERDLEYNFFAVLIYPIYNGVLGAEDVPVNAQWDETRPPKKANKDWNR